MWSQWNEGCHCTQTVILKPELVEAMMFLKLNMSLIPKNPTDLVESLIWNTLIPSRPKLPDDIDNSDGDDDNDDDDLSPMPVICEEPNYTYWFQAFQYSCAKTWKYRATREQYNQIYIVWYCMNGFIYGLEWYMSHNFLPSQSWVKMRVPESWLAKVK